MAVAFFHLPRAGVGVVKGDVEFFERQAKQAVGTIKRGFDHLVELEVGFQLSLIQIVFGRAAFFGVVAPIPRFQIAVDAIGVEHFGKAFRVGVGGGFSGFPDGHEQVADVFGGFGHFRFEFEIGEGFVAQEVCAFIAQIEGFFGNASVVCVAAVFTAFVPCDIGFFA